MLQASAEENSVKDTNKQLPVRKRISINSCIQTLFDGRRRATGTVRRNEHHNGLLDDHRAVEPPESFPNSEVKRSIADGSVGSPHVRVGHRQALIQNPSRATCWGFLYLLLRNKYAVNTKKALADNRQGFICSVGCLIRNYRCCNRQRLD